MTPTESVAALSGDSRGRWVVTTLASTTIVDLDARTLTRYPATGFAPDLMPALALRHDRDTVPVLELAVCAVGAAMVAVIQLRDDGVPTVRTSSPVVSIEPIPGPDTGATHPCE